MEAKRDAARTRCSIAIITLNAIPTFGAPVSIHSSTTSNMARRRVATRIHYLTATGISLAIRKSLGPESIRLFTTASMALLNAKIRHPISIPRGTLLGSRPKSRPNAAIHSCTILQVAEGPAGYSTLRVTPSLRSTSLAGAAIQSRLL